MLYIRCIRLNHYQKKQSGNGQATCGNISCADIVLHCHGVKAIYLLGPTAGKHVLFSLGVWNMTTELELESQSFAWSTLWIWWCWRFCFSFYFLYVWIWICIMCGCFNMAEPGLGTRGLADHRTRLLQWVCSCLSWRWTMTGEPWGAGKTWEHHTVYGRDLARTGTVTLWLYQNSYWTCPSFNEFSH